MRTMLKWLLLCTPVLFVAAAVAEDARPHSRAWYWYVSAGDFDADETAGHLENEGSGFGFVLGIGMRPWRYLALEAEFAGHSAKYDTLPLSAPAGVAFDPRMRVSSAGVVGNAKAVVESGRALFYAGAGLGVFGAQAELEGTLFGFEAERTEDDTQLGYQLIAGAGFPVGERSHVGIEYRRLHLEADFGELSRGETDIGGETIALTFRQRFGSGK